MGILLFDQYSYLHFAVGVVIYFNGISLKNWIIIHIIFELIENTQFGIHFINKYLTYWPGGKPKSDTVVNSIGDILCGIVGWISAYYLDKFGERQGWYKSHIKI
jgi:hypothetical protein